VADNGSFPRQALLTFYQDRSNDADARYVAYQLLLQDEPSSKSNLLETAETDPSLPIRYLKIAAMIDQAAANLESDKPSAQQTLQAVIADGRSPKQLEKATDLLKELGVQVDLADELGLIQKWSVIGPFDNTDSEDFDTVYLPESRYLDLGTPIGTDKSGTVQPEKGKRGEVEWQTVETDDRLGMVDLNPPLENEKDGCAYAFATFTVDSGYTGTAQTRLGCITANKVWVNGKLASSDNVYHSGTRIDQYIGTCELVEGENTVMIKVLQNAQTQPWAQDWEFQFRLTRPNGSAIKTTVVD
jgi:hypothetical protein